MIIFCAGPTAATGSSKLAAGSVLYRALILKIVSLKDCPGSLPTVKS
jgi:hypothetical protein